MDPNRARNTFRNQHQQSLKQRLHHPAHHQQGPVYSSGDSDLENEALSQGLRLTAYGDCGDRDGDDSAEDHIYNQYEKIIDSRTSASSSTLSSSHHPGRNLNPDPASRATHYAESAIYKRSRGTGLNSGNEAWSPTSSNVPSETPSHNASSYQALDPSATTTVGPGKINNNQGQNLMANQVPPSNALHNTFLASSVRDSMDIGHNTTSTAAKISNHHQLRNNLLSSSVRDLMSTLSNRSQHTSATGHGLSTVNSAQGQALLTSSSSQGTYGPLIVATNGGVNGGGRDVYDSSNGGTTGPTCLVRSQSGSRFIFPSVKSDNSGNGLPGVSSYGDHNSIIIRPPGHQGIGTGARLTMGGKIIGPAGRSSPSSGGFSSFSSSFPSRFSKSLSHITCNWRCTTFVLLVISLLTFFALIYTINYRQVTSCSCPLIESSSIDPMHRFNPLPLPGGGGGSNSGHSSYNSLDTLGSSSSSGSTTGITSAACPILCSGRGQYLKGICKCPTGWKGKECELREDECEVADCSGHGICSSGRCNCSPGYTGTNCEIETCPTLCSNRGLYDKGTCKCNPGFKGKDCELRAEQCSPANCSSHGTCVNGNCLCNPGWKGPSCSQVDCLDPDCSGHGICVNGMCLCGKGWKGADCSELEVDSRKCLPDCSGHGTFLIESQSCRCEPGWTGLDCSQERCDRDCGPNGHCSNGDCVCNDGWTGAKCTEALCDLRCLEHGQCKNGSCICHTGWNGRHCTLEGCPNSCSGHGECNQQEGDWICECNPDWAASDCSVALERECSDKRDNDGDGLADCMDSDCCSSKDCSNNPHCLSSPDPLDILLRKQPPPPTASFFQRMQFLIEEDSVQSYAHRPAFNESRASVIRGQVISPSRSGLMGVRVGISSDPLLGFVVTRESGWFDIMVNGGSAVSLHFQREPFSPITKTLIVPWNEIVVIDPVVMSLEESTSPSSSYMSASSSSSSSSATGTSLSSSSAPFTSTLNHGKEQHLSSPYDLPSPSEPYKGPICTDHDYDQMKPFVFGSWKSYPCSPGGLYADGHVLHESLAIPATDLSLVYNSSRSSGYRSVIELTLTPEKIPQSLRLIHLKVTIEGISFSRTFEGDSSLRYTYAWNRRNVYRQKVFGVANAIVSVGYEYLTCSSIIWDTQSVQLPGHDMSISEIGGWNLNIHHRYNFHEGILQKGDGTNIYLKKRPKVMQSIMGDGQQRALYCPYCNGSAKSQRLLAPTTLAAAPDGSIYIGDFNLVRRLSPDGDVSTIVELPSSVVSYKYHLAVAPDGKVYMSDPERHQVMRIVNPYNPDDATKNLEVIAGTGIKCLPGDKHHCGDGKSAKESRLSYPKGIAVSLANEVFIADGTNIRMIDSTGIIHTIVGDHLHKSYWKPFPCTDSGIPIHKINLRWPTELAINPIDNSLHILDDHMVLKVTADKRIKIVAGRPSHCGPVSPSNSNINSDSDTSSTLNSRSDTEYVKATSVFLETPVSIAFSPIGDLYIAESDSQMVNRVRLVSGSGRISRYAGADNKCSCLDRGCDCYNQDNALALNSKMSTITSLTVTPANDIVVCDQGNLRLRVIKPFLPSPNKDGDYEIISQDTMEIYVFNKHGLHTATKSVLSGKFLYNFTYVVNTSFGKLSSVTDATGNRIQLLRDYANQVKEIETSSGSKCRLEMSRTRLLEAFILPNSSKTTFTYNGVTGLIKSKTDSITGNTYSYEYDKNGRLIKAIGPDNEDLRCTTDAM